MEKGQEFITKDRGENSLSILTGRDRVTFSIENPWAGDTETGFGYNCDITIYDDEAIRLRDWLIKVL